MSDTGCIRGGADRPAGAVRERMGVPMRRLIAACAIVALLVAGVPAADYAMRAASGDSDDGRLSESGGINGSAVSAAYAADPFGALDAWEEQMRAPAVQLPPSFLEELGVPPDAYDIRCADAGSAMEVVGYSVELDAASALDDAVEQMSERGWRAVPLGEECGATFVKSQGVYRWALTTCSQMGSSTSVVIRAMRS